MFTDHVIETDFLVAGGGLAGVCAALATADHEPALCVRTLVRAMQSPRDRRIDRGILKP